MNESTISVEAISATAGNNYLPACPGSCHVVLVLGLMTQRWLVDSIQKLGRKT